MKNSFNPILGALIFAMLLIASSYFLKGKSIGNWADAVIYMAGIYCWYRYFMNLPTTCRVSKKNL